MCYSDKRGFTLIEIILVCAIACIILAFGGIAWQRASVNRQLDATAASFEATITLARQTAQNRNGAKIVLTLPSQDTDGKWELLPSDSNEIIKSEFIPRRLGLTTNPSGCTTIEFNSAGGIKSDSTTLSSEGTIDIAFEALGYDRKIVVSVVGMTGAVVKKVQ